MGICKTTSTTDINVAKVISKMQERASVGLNKYGVTTERTDLNLLEWLTHAQEEAMDLAIYLERIKMELNEETEVIFEDKLNNFIGNLD